jgi:hypothetical protein
MHPDIGSQRSWSTFSEVALARTRLESRELSVESSFRHQGRGLFG